MDGSQKVTNKKELFTNTCSGQLPQTIHQLLGITAVVMSSRCGKLQSKQSSEMAADVSVEMTKRQSRYCMQLSLFAVHYPHTDCQLPRAQSTGGLGGFKLQASLSITRSLIETCQVITFPVEGPDTVLQSLLVFSGCPLPIVHVTHHYSSEQHTNPESICIEFY